MVLLVGAGLMMRGFLREQSKLPGLRHERLLTADILLGGTQYFDKTPAGHERRHAARRGLLRPAARARARAARESTRAGIISRLPMDVWTHPFAIVGRPAPEPGKEPQADLNEVDAQALDTLGIRLLRGRGIEERDAASTPWVAVVNKTFADRHFPGQDPLGQAIRISIGPARRRKDDRGAAAARDRGRRRRRGLSELLHRDAGRRLRPVPPARLAVRTGGRVHPHAARCSPCATAVDPLSLVRAVEERWCARSIATRRPTTS